MMMVLVAALRRAAKVQPLGDPLDWMENVCGGVQALDGQEIARRLSA
ncbi:MAG: hypothetical protein IJG18_07020 [Kiritimatiellae bacterium]|nr:hypothetical protein [Kiritimatiellia bacterium]